MLVPQLGNGSTEFSSTLALDVVSVFQRSQLVWDRGS